jgi:hypothetical protein
MRAIILRAAGARLPPPRGDGVFQYLGTLERPGMIGIVRRGGQWTRFDLFREAVSSSRDRWADYNSLPPTQRRRADALIDEWARHRWRQRVLER